MELNRLKKPIDWVQYELTLNNIILIFDSLLKYNKIDAFRRK